MQIAVIGSGAERAGQAEEVGRLLAERGCVVVCGGLGEVMEAAARGAKSAGGTTIGILPGESRAAANEWIDFAVATGTGHARNLAVVASGDAVIAVGGRWGTLAEGIGNNAVLMAMGLTFIVFEGYEIIAQTGEESRNPQKDIPRANFLTLGIATAIFIAVAVVTINRLPLTFSRL